MDQPIKKLKMKKATGAIFADPGVGKTWNLLDTAIRYCELTCPDDDFLIGMYDFDNVPDDRMSQCIELFFGDYEDRIDHVRVLQTGKKEYSNEKSKRSLFDDMDNDEARIDYLKTYKYMNKTVFPHYLKNYKNYDFLGVDDALTVVRSKIGKEVWKSENLDRGEPAPVEWSAINPIEAKVYNKFIIPLNKEGDKHNIPVIFTGLLVDKYVNNAKVGQEIGCTDPVYKAINYCVQLSRAVPKKYQIGDASAAEKVSSIEVVCPKSTRLPWKDTIKPFGKRSMLDCLIENDVVEI
jgi:hypothetical protein